MVPDDSDPVPGHRKVADSLTRAVVYLTCDALKAGFEQRVRRRSVEASYKELGRGGPPTCRPRAWGLSLVAYLVAGWAVVCGQRLARGRCRSAWAWRQPSCRTRLHARRPHRGPVRDS